MFCAQCGQWLAEGEASCPRCGAPAHGAAFGPLPGAVPAPAPPAEVAVRYGGFWRRFGSAIVDTLVLYFPAAIIRVACGVDAFGMEGSWAEPAVLRAAGFNFVLYWLYCALLESSPAQGTLGQMLMGLRVCDDGMRRISFLRATGRNWGQLLTLLTCGIGYLVNLWTKKRQTLHDLAAGCVIVRAGEPARQAGAAAGGAS